MTTYICTIQYNFLFQMTLIFYYRVLIFGILNLEDDGQYQMTNNIYSLRYSKTKNSNEFYHYAEDKFKTNWGFVAVNTKNSG